MNNFGLYLILTNPGLPHRVIASIAVDRGIQFIQLREKDVSDRFLLTKAEEILKETVDTNTKLIMNDRPDLALLAQANGVHLGQDDLLPGLAEKIYPREKGILGLSTHTPEQAEIALKLKPDYIGYGPIYPTTTKKIPDPTVGTDSLKKILQKSPLPVVAIGGIFPENLDSILAAGAKNICMVRHFMECSNEELLLKRIDHIKKQLEPCK